MNAAQLRRVVRRLELRARRALGGSSAGLSHAVHRGRGLDFEEVRLYQPGDDVRDVDWKASARTGKVFLKRFNDERQITLWILVDASPAFLWSGEFCGEASDDLESSAWSKRRFVLEWTTLLALSAALRLDRVGLCLFGADVQTFRPATGERHALRLARELTETLHRDARPIDSDGVQRSLERAVAAVAADKGPALVFPVGGWNDSRSAVHLGRLARRSEVRALRVLHPWERKLPDKGLVRWRSAENGGTCVVDCASPKIRAAYENSARRHSAEIRRRFVVRRMELVEATTDRSAAQWLLQTAGR